MSDAIPLLPGAPAGTDAVIRALRVPRTPLEVARLVPLIPRASLDGILAALEGSGLGEFDSLAVPVGSGLAVVDSLPVAVPSGLTLGDSLPVPVASWLAVVGSPAPGGVGELVASRATVSASAHCGVTAVPRAPKARTRTHRRAT